MRKEDQISDEQLSAFTDGELEAEDENRIFTLAEECPELDARLCRQRKLKELVQHAYRDVPRPRGRDKGHGPRRNLLGLAAAAALLLTAGMAGGWFASRAVDGESGSMATALQPNADTILLHVTSSDPKQMQRALNRAEELMTGGAESANRRVEVVANEGGLDLLRTDRTPFAEQITRLAEQDVLFFACSRAIQRLEELGNQVRLVPEADARYSALDRVVLRMQQGWTYEKI